MAAMLLVREGLPLKRRVKPTTTKKTHTFHTWLVVPPPKKNLQQRVEELTIPDPPPKKNPSFSNFDRLVQDFCSFFHGFQHWGVHGGFFTSWNNRFQRGAPRVQGHEGGVKMMMSEWHGYVYQVFCPLLDHSIRLCFTDFCWNSPLSHLFVVTHK